VRPPSPRATGGGASGQLAPNCRAGERFGLTNRLATVTFFDVIHAGSQTRMAMMRALPIRAAVQFAVCV
jgi:hypothetical protein